MVQCIDMGMSSILTLYPTISRVIRTRNACNDGRFEFTDLDRFTQNCANLYVYVNSKLDRN